VARSLKEPVRFISLFFRQPECVSSIHSFLP